MNIEFKALVKGYTPYPQPVLISLITFRKEDGTSLSVDRVKTSETMLTDTDTRTDWNVVSFEYEDVFEPTQDGERHLVREDFRSHPALDYIDIEDNAPATYTIIPLSVTLDDGTQIKIDYESLVKGNSMISCTPDLLISTMIEQATASEDDPRLKSDMINKIIYRAMKDLSERTGISILQLTANLLDAIADDTILQTI